MNVALAVSQAFSRIRDVSRCFYGCIPIRKGYGEFSIHGRKYGVSCIERNNGMWENIISPDYKTITERKIVQTDKAFENRVKDYIKNLLHVDRLVFVKEADGKYHYCGVYRLRSIDFFDKSIVFERIGGDTLLVIDKKVVKIEITEEITREVVFI